MSQTSLPGPEEPIYPPARPATYQLATTSSKKYILEKEFIDAETSKKLRDFCEQQLSKNKPTINVNHSYDNRVVYYEGLNDNPEIKILMKNIHDRVVKKLVELYQPKSPIYPEATHLVKWPEGTSLGNHADNAYEDGTPNYVPWRTHSAVIHLNEDYEGGHFYFRDELPITHPPTTGRLVAFGGGIDFVHGVQKVTKGERYTMPMWFCQDKSRAYQEYRY